MTKRQFEKYLDWLIDVQKLPTLGSGAFSYVFEHPDDPRVACKVAYNDPYGAEYIRWCVDHQRNKYVPKIYEHVTEPLGRKQLHYVFMERLRTPRRKTCKRIAAEWYQLGWGEPVPHEITFDDLFTDDCLVLARQTKDRALAEVMDFLTLPRRNDACDIHNGNVMMRHRQAVIVDGLGYLR